MKHQRIVVPLAVLTIVATGCGPRGSDSGVDAATDAGGTDTGTDAGPSFDPSTVPEDAALFIFGVAAGDVDDSSVMVWTRYLGTEPLRLMIFEADAAGDPGPVALDAPAVTPNARGIVKQEAMGLQPGTAYVYVFLEEDGSGGFLSRSRLGRFRTAPAAGTLEPITFAISGDANEGFMPYTVLAAAAADDPAFFVFNGDHVYADGAATVEDYYGYYETNWSDPNLQDLMATTAFYSIWDDHEVVNNWNAETVDPMLLANGRTAFFDYTSIRPNPTVPERLWRSYRHGDTLELFILDIRSERIPSAGEYISAEQKQWLKDGLLASTATYKLIVNTVPITDLTAIGDDDRWTNYPGDRDDILDFIATNNLEHVFWLSADIHISLIGYLSEYGGYDLVSGPIGQILVDFAAGFLTLLPSVEYASAEVDNYHLITVDPTAMPPTLRLEIKDEGGNVLLDRTFTE